MMNRVKKYLYDQYPLLSVASGYWSVARDMKKYGVRITPFGFRFMGPKELQEGRYEPAVSELIRKRLEDCTLFVDGS